MSVKPDKQTTVWQLGKALLAGVVSGVVRAIMGRVLDQFMS
jgi:hypothetical protein